MAEGENEQQTGGIAEEASTEIKGQEIRRGSMAEGEEPRNMSMEVADHQANSRHQGRDDNISSSEPPSSTTALATDPSPPQDQPPDQNRSGEDIGRDPGRRSGRGSDRGHGYRPTQQGSELSDKRMPPQNMIQSPPTLSSSLTTPIPYIPWARQRTTHPPEYALESALGPFPCARVHGLPFEANVEDVVHFFFRGLFVVDILVLNPQQDRTRAGMFTMDAFVLFSNMSDLESAIQRNGGRIGNRPIEVYRGTRDEYYGAIASVTQWMRWVP